MLERIGGVFRRIGAAARSVFGSVAIWLFRPFRAGHDWYSRRAWIVRAPLLALLVLLIGLYGYFFWQTQVWTNFNPNFVDEYRLGDRKVAAGQELPPPVQPAAPQANAAQTDAGQPATSQPVAGGAADPQLATPMAAQRCQRSAIVDVAADLTDFNVNQNAWISSMLLYRLGFFGIDWDHTPFLDNKASFQRGVNQAMRRTTTELVDTLGRVRGTSGINNDLQNARGNLQFDEYSWYFGINPFGPKTPTPSYYRTAIESLRRFNTDLADCKAIFDGRADNFVQFIDRIANDLGSTADMLAERSENHNLGWFDTRADDRFWFAYGQLYGYYAIISAAGADFSQVIAERNLGQIFASTKRQFQAALRIQPMIISNGAEDGSFAPSHLATMGFYTLRVRSNLVEMRSVLDR